MTRRKRLRAPRAEPGLLVKRFGVVVRKKRAGRTSDAMPSTSHTRWAVFVEGPSDRAAVEALARRLRRNLASEGVEVASIGGAHALARHLSDLPAEVRAAGLCDAGEIGAFGRALERAGIGTAGSRETLEQLGFYVCEPDLESELIRALGAAGVEAVLERSGKLASFRTFQKQPQWEGRPVEAQLRRFFGSSAGKIRHAPLMVDALDLDRIPRPLAALLAHVGEGRSTY
jgi:hypothetical protein